ncbi:MAG: DUF5011 domain-containing protein [Myxococcaceae bacterium]|nr:DUF5011 domain-containing protein [Myxococcaceae bacterium]
MRTRAVAYVVLSSLLWAWPGAVLSQELAGAEQTFTTDADFALGSFQGTRAGAPDSDQLRINTGASVPPYFWLTHSSSGFVTRLDTRTGQQVARYDSVLVRNWDGSLPVVRPPRETCNAPLSTAVDARGDAFVVNRGACSSSVASITKYAGTLAACVDRNGNGTIDTSTDANGDGTVNINDALEFPGQADECILWTKNYAAAGDAGRSLVVDADQNLWAAGFSSSQLFKLDGQTGAVLKVIDLAAETGVASGIQSLAIGPGGALYTTDGTSQRLLRKVDPDGAPGSYVLGTLVAPVPTYGIAVDGSGVAWLGADSDSAAGVVRADFAAGTAQMVGGGGGCTGRTHGVAVDATGDIWAACWGGNRLLRLGSDGAFKATWFINSRPEGVAVAADGRIWVSTSGSTVVAIINPSVSSTVQTVPQGHTQLTYGDMTGYQHHHFVRREGSWSVVHDSGLAGMRWGTLRWNQEPQGATPPGSSITVAVRAAGALESLPAQAFAQVANGQEFAGIEGRFIEVRATLTSKNHGGDPVLSDLTLIPSNSPPVALCRAQDVCAGPACTAEVSVDDGSYDPDGDALSLSQSPAGPYGIGARAVSLTVSDGLESASCSGEVQVRDCEAPSITCGPPVQAECTGNESAAVSAGGAEATDACSTVSVSGPGLASYPLGSTPVTYTATDAAGNTSSCTTQVEVADTLPPSITCPAPATAECVGGGASNSGVASASASDVCSAVAVQAPGLASFPLGTATLSWSASDTSGNLASCSTPFTVADTQAPTLTLNGAAAMTLDCAQPFVDPGATAVDACHGDLTPQLTVSGTVDTQHAGAYVLTYGATDPSGNSAAPVSRTVLVRDSQLPVITLNGANPLPLECMQDWYADPGATAVDGCAGDVSSAIIIQHPYIDSATPGSYPVTYSVADSDGNVATAVREVLVQDTLPPTLTVLGSTTTTMVECSQDVIIAAGATATDLCAGDVTHRITISGTQGVVAPGTYPITYSVTDPSGNAAQSITRNVTVKDTQAPVVTILGEANMVLECNVDTYTELGATAYDACQGDMTSQLRTYGNGANPAAVGTYSIEYGVWDASGNTTKALRKVKVVDSLPPTLTLVGPATLHHECASGVYVDPGATAQDACFGDLTTSISRTGSVNAWSRGAYTLTYAVQDSTLLKATPITRTVQVADTQAPTLTYRDVTLWPGDHTLRSFSLADCVTASDACDGWASANNGTILSIYSDEPEDVEGDNDGGTLEDIVITSKSSFKLRAERNSGGDGRVYGVNFELKDQTGNVRVGLCRIQVPASQGGTAQDSGAGAGYTVLPPPPASLAQRTSP